jgi:Family of unknown function (DUF6526)
MSKTEPSQDFKHHGRLHPPFHIIGFGLLLANLIAVIVHLVRHPTPWNGWLLVLSIGIFVPYFLIRMYALKVQDRVIRLEERVRLKELAPAEWRPQIEKLNENQLIGLRFASDQEVVALAGQALAENLSRKQIKERIKTWRPDYWRV